jgi:hypothetical protein
MDLIIVLFKVGLSSLEGPCLKIGPISMPLAFVVGPRSVKLRQKPKLFASSDLNILHLESPHKHSTNSPQWQEESLESARWRKE